MIDLEAKAKYQNINEALMQVYEMGAVQDVLSGASKASTEEIKFLAATLIKVIERNFEWYQQGVSKQLQKKAGFDYKTFDGNKLHRIKALDQEQKPIGLPGGDASYPFKPKFLKVRDAIHAFLTDFEHEINETPKEKGKGKGKLAVGALNPDGYFLAAKDCFAGNKMICAPKNVIANLGSEDSYDHFIVRNNPDSEPTTKMTPNGPEQKKERHYTVGVIRLKNVLSAAEIELDFRILSQISFINADQKQ